MDRAVTVEDIQRKLPQLAGGANSTGATVGDSLGSSTLDLRGLGQNRALVLIDGTRATPFSFRNAVDVNSIPVGLIENVEVLTGGAAAVYGADAVAGVVNFVLKHDFEGVDISVGYEAPDGGAELFNVDLVFGTDIQDDRGHLTAYLGWSEREGLLAGERSFTSATRTLVAGEGGNFTDVASGNFFSFDESGNFSTERQEVDVTPQRFLIQPLDRYSGGLLFDYDIADKLTVYGRAMFTQVEITGAGSTGQTPVTVNEVVTISDSNPFLPAEAAALLTFDGNGDAQVNVERDLGFGMQRTETVRDTVQYQLGLRGDITDYVGWDLYGQFGRTDGTATVFNNAIRNTSSGSSRFGAIANTVDIFGPNPEVSALSDPLLHSERLREQRVLALTFSGSLGDWFELPAGDVGFAFGFEHREEDGVQRPGTALRNGLAFGLGGIPDIDASFDSDEWYAEVLIPLLSDLPLIQELSVEAAWRTSDYTNTDVDDTYKWGLSWAVNDDLRFRATQQTMVRAPNFGEFASPETQLTLSLFDPTHPNFIPRLGGRYDGDPCLDGRGDQAQCDRFGAAAPGTPFDTTAAIYSFGGNPNIKPEEAESLTIGFVFTPGFVDGLAATVDYYEIEVTDAVSQIQPISALTNCYIDNPVADNPLCGAVLRDPATGLISQALVNDFNLARLEQKGFDIGVRYGFDAPDGLGGSFELTYQANLVTDQLRQNNVTVAALDCKGTFGTSCTGDFASILQADYRHRAAADWSNDDDLNVQLSWRRIGEVTNILDSSDTIGAQNYFDLAVSWEFADGYSVTFGVDNLADEKPPLPISNGNLFGTISDYDVIGRTIGATVRMSY
jgi:outer membrane receptor protein involved in Fe transport